MLDKCSALAHEIRRLAGMSQMVDALSEYRTWLDKQGLESEGEDGWPKPFVFSQANREAFANHWKEGSDV